MAKEFHMSRELYRVGYLPSPLVSIHVETATEQKGPKE
jgi:hypothetical protein